MRDSLVPKDCLLAKDGHNAFVSGKKPVPRGYLPPGWAKNSRQLSRACCQNTSAATSSPRRHHSTVSHQLFDEKTVHIYLREPEFAQNLAGVLP
jgi:hypothetical protein